MSDSQFIQGQKDCKAGLPPQSQDEGYLSGYSIQYEMEQIDNALSVSQNKDIQS